MLYVLPDSAGDILVVQASATLTQSDYQDIFLAQIKKQLKPNHKLRVLMYFDHNLTDVEAESNWCNAGFMSECEATIARVAIVADSQWENWVGTFSAPVKQHFKVTEFLSALHWCDEQDV